MASNTIEEYFMFRELMTKDDIAPVHLISIKKRGRVTAVQDRIGFAHRPALNK